MFDDSALTDLQGGPAIRAFSPAEALAAWSSDLSPGDIDRWVIDRLHPFGPRCPQCTVDLTDDRRRARWYSLDRIQCPNKECNSFFTALAGTFLHKAQLDLRQVYHLAVFTHAGVPIDTIARLIGCHADTVRSWQTKFQALQEVTP